MFVHAFLVLDVAIQEYRPALICIVIQSVRPVGKRSQSGPSIVRSPNELRPGSSPGPLHSYLLTGFPPTSITV